MGSYIIASTFQWSDFPGPTSAVDSTFTFTDLERRIETVEK